VVGSLAKNKKGWFLKKLLPYLEFSQIWLNHSMDHRHFGYIYITKLTKETPVGSFAKNKEGNIFLITFISSL